VASGMIGLVIEVGPELRAAVEAVRAASRRREQGARQRIDELVGGVRDWLCSGPAERGADGEVRITLQPSSGLLELVRALREGEGEPIQ
jgi:hypothetical protein